MKQSFLNGIQKGMLGAVLTLAMLAAATAQAATIYVDASQPNDTGDGLSWATAKKLLNAGAIAAVPGYNDLDEIWVKGGTYPGTAGVVVRISKSHGDLKVLGGFPAAVAAPTIDQRDASANPVIVDGQNVRICWDIRCTSASASTLTTTIDGLTFRNGSSASALASGVDFVNGASLALKNCRIENCKTTVSSGAGSANGGLALRSANVGATAVLENCVVAGNEILLNGTATSSLRGAGVSVTVPTTITGCQISGNKCTASVSTSGAIQGGAVFVNVAGVSFVNCDISDNVASSLSTTITGGVMYLGAVATGSTFADCRLVGNRTFQEVAGSVAPTYQGCAVYTLPPTASFTDTVFANNSLACNVATATNVRGAAVYSNAASGANVFNGCVFSGNIAPRGPMVATGNIGATQFNNCLITGNTNTYDYSVAFHYSGAASSHSYVNCDFYDNMATANAAATVLRTNSGTTGGAAVNLLNCIFSENQSSTAPVYEFWATGQITGEIAPVNCLFDNNSHAALFHDRTAGGTDVDYATVADINTNVPNAALNIAGASAFQMGGTGAWEIVSASTVGNVVRTVLTDDQANFGPVDSLVGQIVCPDTASPNDKPRHAFIVANTATILTVVGDVSAFVAAADTYKILDLSIGSASAAIDQADDAALSLTAPATDIVGTARLDASAIANAVSSYDIGAYEFSGAIPAVAPLSVDFGTTITEYATAAVAEVTVSNGGTQAIDSFAYTLDDTTNFALVGAPDTGALAAGASRVITVSFDPISSSNFASTLSITPSGATQIDVALTGVGDANDAPVVAAFAPATAPIGAVFSASTVATDANTTQGDFLTFSIAPAGWLTIDANTGALLGTPTLPADQGLHTWTITATDRFGVAASQTFDVTVEYVAPAFTTDPIVLPNATLGQAYAGQSLADFANTPSGTTTYSKVAGPAWLSVDANTGALSGTPAAAAVDTWTVRIQNSHGDSDEAQLQITVVDLPPASPASAVECWERY